MHAHMHTHACTHAHTYMHILTHSGGAGRTGTFIANSILLERLKTEGVVDVFHTARALRLQRPGMIQTVVRCCGG